MTRITLRLSMAFALLCFAQTTFAQERFGQSGSFAIGVERVTGFASSTSEWEIDETLADVEFEEDTTSFHLLASDPESPFVAPRVGFDFFLIDGLSLGGFIAYVNNESEATTTLNGAETESENKSSAFVLGPRIGYAAMFSDSFGIWPRGGFTWISAESENENEVEVTSSVVALSVEAMFVAAPVEHVAFIFGPTFDYTISGEGEYDDPNVPPDGFEADIDDLKIHSFGVHAGLVAWF